MDVFEKQVLSVSIHKDNISIWCMKDSSDVYKKLSVLEGRHEKRI